MDLTEEDKKLLALALQGLCMRQGPRVFDMVARLAEKLEILGYLEEYLRDWIGYAKRGQEF